MLKSLSRFWKRQWRRRFGRYQIDDPRPIAEAAPYTYFLPSENELLALESGDQVKLIFIGNPVGQTYGAERMWVTITDVSNDVLVGQLDNIPFELHQLRVGDVVRFGRHQIIDIDWNRERIELPPAAPPRRWYWERCLVDQCVIDDGVPVYYIYREEPDMTEQEDKYPDSGWRIRGDYRDISDEARDAREVSYVALGVVLNSDDSWLHLIDEPVGSAFIRLGEGSTFVTCED